MRRTVIWFAIAALASIGFVVIAALLHDAALDQLDIRIELAIHRFDSAPADAVMKTATAIGSNYVLFPAAAIAALLAVRRRRPLIAIVLIVDTAVVVLADEVLKLMFSRARPTLFDKIALPADSSFPSGHAMSAVGVWGVIAAVVIALYPRARGPAIAAAAVLIAAIGLSRIYLGVHWPFDVLGGYLGGIPPLVASVLSIHRQADPAS